MNAVVIVYAETVTVIVAATYGTLFELDVEDRLAAFVTKIHGDRRVRAHCLHVFPQLHWWRPLCGQDRVHACLPYTFRQTLHRDLTFWASIEADTGTVWACIGASCNISYAWVLDIRGTAQRSAPGSAAGT